MRIERALEIRDELANHIHETYRSAKFTKPTSEELHAKLRSIRDRLPKETPRWVFSYGEGIESVLQNEIYHKHLEFCYMVDGKLYSIRKESSRWYEKYFTPSELQKKATKSGHYWIDTDKEYFVTLER